MRPIILAALLCVAAVPSWAADRLPNFPKRQAYGQARASLLKLGWKPATKKIDPDNDCSKFDDRCREYPEADSCSGSGEGPCRFDWIGPQGSLVAVYTKGESPPIVSGTECLANCR